MKATIVRIGGEIDIASGSLLSRISALASDSQIVVMDVERLKYADTTFLRFLLDLKRAGREVRLAGLNPRCRRVFEVTGLSSQFGFYDAASEATHGAASVEWLAPLRAIA